MTTQNTNKVAFEVASNNDTGSLHIGAAYQEGFAFVQLTGEAAPRKISYVMGKAERTHVCCKGFGKFPEGKVSGFLIKE